MMIKRLFKSFSYAGRGLVKVWQDEQNFRLEIIAAAVVVGAGIFWRVSARDWAILFAMIALVLLAEIANSAAEIMSDVLKPRMNHYVGQIKDLMAAAVLLAAITALAVGLAIFWPYWFGRI